MTKKTRFRIAVLGIAILTVALLACGPLAGVERTEPAPTPVASQPTAEAPTAVEPTKAPPEATATATPRPLLPSETPSATKKARQTPSIGDVIPLLPTAPPSPQPGASPVPTAEEPLTLPFRDDFSDPASGWYTQRDEVGFSDYENRAFRMWVGKANWLVYSGVAVWATDVTIEVDAENVGGVDDNSFGIYCRQQGDSFYYFELASDGFYKIAKFVNDEYSELIPWTETDAIWAGHAVNHMRIECVGNTLTLYANDTLLAQTRDNELSSGYIGLVAGSFDTPGVDILFDNFVAVAPEGSRQSPAPAGEPRLGPITFAEDVTDDGELIGPASEFPAGTTAVWSYFTFDSMEDGQPWGRLWERDGEVYIDSRDDLWEEGANGWLAYYISDDTPLSGRFTLTLYIGDEPVQRASFGVAEPVSVDLGSSAAFGAIKFARDVTAEAVPIGVASEFEAGITEVYAVFPFMNMADGQSWAREWLHDGEALVRKDVAWDEGREGITYWSYVDEEGLEPGRYTLSLYIGGQLARSAGFEVAGLPEPEDVPRGPADPEDIVDPELLPAWRMLANASPDILRELADFVLRHHIEMRIDGSYSGNAAYRSACNPSNPQPGKVVVSRTYWNNNSWEVVTAALGHELYHAVDSMNGGKCECTVEEEYHAWVVTLYVLQELDRMDLLEEKYRGVYDESGRFDRNKLWAVVKETYSDCSEY